MNRRRISLNLTPLLDVILLMLFAYQVQSVQRVAASANEARASAALKERADLDMEHLAEEKRVLVEQKKALEKELADLREKAELERKPSVLAETLEEMTKIDQKSLEQALSEASDEDRREVQKMAKRMEGRSASEVVRELAKLESFNKYVSSWFLHLKAERGYGEGVSQIKVIVDEAAPVVRNLGTSSAELENFLEKLLREELGGALEKSQLLVVLTVSAQCDLYKRNKDDFIAVLQDKVFPGLKNDRALAGTQFLFAGEESQCRTEP